MVMGVCLRRFCLNMSLVWDICCSELGQSTTRYSCLGVMYGEWYGVCDFVVFSVVKVCVNYGGVNVFHVFLDFCIVYCVGVCVNVQVVLCVSFCLNMVLATIGSSSVHSINRSLTLELDFPIPYLPKAEDQLSFSLPTLSLKFHTSRSLSVPGMFLIVPFS